MSIKFIITKTSSTHNSNGSCKSHCSISRSSYHIYNLPKNILDKPPFPPFQCYWWKLIQNRGFCSKKNIFQHWKRGGGMFHIFRMIYLLKLTVSQYILWRVADTAKLWREFRKDYVSSLLSLLLMFLTSGSTHACTKPRKFISKTSEIHNSIHRSCINIQKQQKIFLH